MARLRIWVLTVVVAAAATSSAMAQAPVAYRLSFPEREHRLMQVDALFRDVPAGPLQVRMSRSSPGRYSIHEFAKNVFDVRITDGMGRPLLVSRPNPHEWDVTGHAGTVRVQYRVFGDRVDGTYLAIDSTHAHINMPAALMWATGLERRTMTVHFERPAGTSWSVATQLMPGGDSYTYSAPNLQYLMDSPTEFSQFALRTFTASDESRTPVFRLAVHHAGTDAELDGLARDVQTIVREARHVFGEYPPFEGNTYTFIADYLPWANGDGMEHRNSTVLTSSSSLRTNRADILGAISHEFFHSWNVERIRPQSLEPYNLDDVNVSGELWLAEGFTNYYGSLILKRTGLTSVRAFTQDMGSAIDTVANSPGRAIRTAVEMSQMAPFVDRAVSIDRTNFDNTFISYYTWGSVIGLGLDLTLRDRSEGRVTLDDFMRALWEKYGKPGTRTPGYVETPYTIDDLKSVLAAVSGEAMFANDFFARYIEGHEMIDFPRLLGRAGLVLRPSAAGRAFAGALRVQDGQAGVRIVEDVRFGSPAYAAGLERDDVIVSLGGTRVVTAAEMERAVLARKPGESLQVVFERRGERVTSVIKLAEDPRLELVAAEDAGQTLSDAQRQFREKWLSSGARTF
ncbi:MAG TPA: PDZ domain-containing protein [Vicinamibacterales bacterium]|nr:PDZ domain-containing protein [Vicinamibacterales bacterium]